MHDRKVFAHGRVLTELLREVLLRRQRARKDEKATRFLVESMYDAEGRTSARADSSPKGTVEMPDGLSTTTTLGST
jgi:hypothetical protein